jgi:predicted Zn-dependent protease
VYSYGGGPGLRTGNPKDVERLLIAGLYNQSREDRKAGRPAEAAALIDELAKRMPQDPEARLLRVESLMLDRKNYAAAVAAADSIAIEPANARLRARQATLKADAFISMGQRDSARAVLSAAAAAMPTNTRLKAKLDSLK